jgi:hypothetical protein
MGFAPATPFSFLRVALRAMDSSQA